MSDYLLSYYGDDFTGSTDVMEALTINGVKTVLFLDVPTQEQLRQFPDVQAVGIAGTSRSMTPEQMKVALPPVFRGLETLQATFTHYKICSTFDSSPTLGSIGYAIELALETFAQTPSLIPLVVGVPVLLRYVVFGNLFASVQGITHRLDRHPTMSVHPATPMNEADLRLHLAKQTALSMHSINVLDLAQEPQYLVEQLAGFEQENETRIVLFDTLDRAHLQTIGQTLLEYHPTQTKFVVGSSGVEYALVEAWQQHGIVQAPATLPTVSPIEQLLVMSGSASPVTKRQIETLQAKANAHLIAIDTAKLVHPDHATQERERLVEESVRVLKAGHSLVLHTAIGSDDPRLNATRQAFAEQGLDPTQTASVLGKQQGLIVNDILAQVSLPRVCIVGGDTSGHVAHAMGITALEFVASVAPGAPLCRATGVLPTSDGLEISFKGGQNGKEDYFLKLLG
jgi:uncharacterized protein YgbK (DUF1537 family)